MSINPLEASLDKREIDIAPNQRFANIGKTRCGKTAFSMALSGLLVPMQSDWEAWWIDTKHDPKDIAALYEWGYSTTVPKTGFWNRLWQPEKPSPRRLFIANSKGEAQDIVGRAYDKRGVLVIVDEYTEVVQSQQNPGEELLDVFTRGGGVDVGLIGHTQEPVYVPRQLLSQATHQFLFNVSYPYDIQYLQGLFQAYIRPTRLPVEDPDNWGHTSRQEHSHGFYHIAVDYDGEGEYFRNMYQWFKTIQGGIPW